LDQTVELLAKGASDFISKPFPETGRTLARVIQDVLAAHRKKYPDAAAAMNQPPKAAPFAGGTLAFYPDHIELCGETILERTHRGHAWTVLHLLRERNSRGNYVRHSGEALAKDVNRGLGQNAIAQCVAALRDRIIEVMGDRLGLVCNKHDVIDNRGSGYHLTPKVVVEVHDGEQAPAENTVGRVTNDTAVTKSGAAASVSLNERQRWVVSELTKGARVQRSDVESRFAVAARTAKRDLKSLITVGLIEFVRTPRRGYYRLAER